VEGLLLVGAGAAAAAVLLLCGRVSLPGYSAAVAAVAVAVALLLQAYLNKGGKGCQVDEKRAVAQIPLDTITRTVAPTPWCKCDILSTDIIFLQTFLLPVFLLK